MEKQQEQALVSVRDIPVITGEIKTLCRQAQTMMLLYAVEIGRRLEEAKQLLPYGPFDLWKRQSVIR